jgi:hypothetical protein
MRETTAIQRLTTKILSPTSELQCLPSTLDLRPLFLCLFLFIVFTYPTTQRKKKAEFEYAWRRNGERGQGREHEWLIYTQGSGMNIPYQGRICFQRPVTRRTNSLSWIAGALVDLERTQDVTRDVVFQE